VLINNAGINVPGKVDEVGEGAVEAIVKVNLVAHFHTIREFLPEMKRKNKGHIVTISSVAGVISVPNQVAYNATKFAVFGLDEGMRVELKSEGYHGVKTTCICPFFIKTGMFKGCRTNSPLLMPILEVDWASKRFVDAIR